MKIHIYFFEQQEFSQSVIIISIAIRFMAPLTTFFLMTLKEEDKKEEDKDDAVVSQAMGEVG